MAESNTELISEYKYNEAELKALDECSTESFFKRSLPLATILGIGAHMAVKNGYLKVSFLEILDFL